MIKLSELLHNKYDFDSLPKEHQNNIKTLLSRLNEIRKLYGKPMTITSGYRSMDDHLRIYQQKGITDRSKIPMGSKHLYGQAADIFDPNQELQKWCLANVGELERIGVWCEHFDHTPNWVHFQIVPPKSKKRFFKP